MEPKGYMPYFEEPHILAEIDIRGRFLQMSADIEFSMLTIMVYSTPDPYNQIRRFKGMMMNQKIECTIKDLKDYKPHYYAKYEPYFNDLKEFKDIRNDLSHHKMEFPDKNDLSKFRVIFADETTGIEQLHCREYAIEYLKDAVKRFRKANVEFARLIGELYADQVANGSLPPVP